MSMQIECPHCRAANQVGDAARGCYVPGTTCDCKLYVPVPPLGEESSPARLARPAPRPLCDTDDNSNSGGRVLMRQESLLATIHEDLASLRWHLVCCTGAIVLAGSLLNLF